MKGSLPHEVMTSQAGWENLLAGINLRLSLNVSIIQAAGLFATVALKNLGSPGEKSRNYWQNIWLRKQNLCG